MKVVIVAKTRMGSGACVGGLTFDGRSVRLIPADKEFNDQFNLEYEVGDVWDIDYSADEQIVPPHVENIVVTGKRKHPPIDDLSAFIERHLPAKAGGLEALYEGLTQATKSGALYINERSGVPPYSTMFWRPDAPLVRVSGAKRIRYQYGSDGSSRTLTFTGFQETVEEIPAGTLLRISLAHWWCPDDMPDGELRCYVQLSGWVQPQIGQDQAVDMFYVEDQDSFDPSFDPELDSLPEIDPITITAGDAPDMETAQVLLKQIFGFDDFRSLQAAIIENVIENRDSLAIMPTGSGKSLCYQLPALMFPGLTVVVSPLISLMQDQVEQLHELGIPAAYLNSTLTFRQYQQTTSRLRAGKIKLLYAAPETLLRPETLLLLEECSVSCLTIDEAHCISQWGHDFRPEYRQLVEVRRRLSGAVCIAVTATATERVRQDIKHTLAIDEADEFIASFNRENLFLSVEPKTEALGQALAFLNAHPDESGIIYCSTRKEVDMLSEELSARGYQVLPYHGGMDTRSRQQNQRQFTLDNVPIMVATIAFGMGIDKSNVRFILHYAIPKNLESYYQQIGRAGRDGLRADCLLLFGYKDIGTIQFFIQQQDPAQQVGAQMRIQAMVSYAETRLCRRKPLLGYFDEPFEAESCDFCDNCLSEDEDLIDITVAAQKFLSCVKRTGEFFGAAHIVNVLRGSRAKTVLSRGHDRLSTYGIGTEYSKKEWAHLARQFIQLELLGQDMEHGSLKLKPAAYEVFKGKQVLGTLLQGRKTAAKVQTEYDRTLFGQLRIRRKTLADAAGHPPYTVFSDRSLAEMATYYPRTEEAFSHIHGVGQVKLRKYAGEFLPIIHEYCAANGIEEKPRRMTSATPRITGKSRSKQVIDLYNGGASVADIAGEFGVKIDTVIGHLWKGLREGERLRSSDLRPLSQLAPADKQQVLDTFDELGVEFLRPVFDALAERVSYAELRLLRLHYVLQHMGS